jgi:hypothetical protein
MALRPSQPPIQWVLGALSPEVKQPGCDAAHLHLVVSLRLHLSICLYGMHHGSYIFT